MKRKKIAAKKTSSRNVTYFSDILITVATVVHNDADIIAEYLQEVSVVLRKQSKFYEILVVDNGSVDKTRMILLQLQKRLPNIRVLVLSQEYDQQVGYIAALENSIGDYVVSLDAASDPPAFIPKLIKIAQTGYNIVTAERRDQQGKTPIEKGVIKSAGWFLSKLAGFSLPLYASRFRILSREVVTAITRARNSNRYAYFYDVWPGFKQASLPYSAVNRRRKKRSVSSLASFAIGLRVVLNNSIIPLRMATYLGICATFFSGIVVAYLAAVAVLDRPAFLEWGLIPLFGFSMCTFMFAMLTVITSYIDRMLNDPKGHSQYLITEEYNSTVIAETKRVNVV